jgi:hypothetical protein
LHLLFEKNNRKLPRERSTLSRFPRFPFFLGFKNFGDAFLTLLPSTRCSTYSTVLSYMQSSTRSSFSVGTSLEPPNSMMVIMEDITSLTKKAINIEGLTVLSISSHDVPQSESACKVIAASAIHRQSAW